MVEALDNKCPSCGAKITFNPKIQKWDCEYCGSKFSLEEMQKHNNASSEEANKSEPKFKKMGKMDVYHCKNCGAEIMADETVTATFCVYCGSTAILKDKIDDGIAPNLIIPFKKVKEDAVKAFSELTKRKPLMPREFKEIRNIEKISGVYIPFWSYDLQANGNMSFLSSDVRHWSDSKNDYTEVTKYTVDTEGHFEYAGVLADASSRFDDDLMDSLEPFDYKELTKYNHAYLSGFMAEKYDVLEEDGLKRATERTMNTCTQILSSKIRHQSSVLQSNNMNITKTGYNYLMLPVWMVSVNYKGKGYIFAMNGQTGKIVGNIPIGVKESVLWSILLFVVFFIVTTVVLYFVG